MLFVGGAVTFLVCAGQVYFNKLFRKGVALRGLYARIRHPQYVGLAATGLGLAILWPRFLVLALWNVMVVLYYVLARDEERRMVARFDVQYREYMERTGMFLPRAIENRLARKGGRSGGTKALLSFAVLACATIGGAFALRACTVAMLPLWSDGPPPTPPSSPATCRWSSTGWRRCSTCPMFVRAWKGLPDRSWFTSSRRTTSCRA